MEKNSILSPQEKLIEEVKSSDSLLRDLKDKARSSLYFLTKAILNFNKLTPHFHQDFCSFIQRFDILRKMNLLPRGHYKTTCGTIGYSIWLMIQEEITQLKIAGSEIRILLCNESATNAENFLSAIEGVFDENELFRTLFSEIIPDKSKRKRWNQQEMLINRESSWPEATLQTIGVGGAAQSRHYDVIIFDDLIGKEAMDSETVMEKTISWFDYAESLFVSPTKGIAVVNGTRWSKRDLYQHILEKDKRYQVYSRQCIENDKPIFPEEFTTEFFDELRVKNFAHFSSQYLNDPTDPSKCDFKESWLKLYAWEKVGDRLCIKFEDDDKAVDFREFDIVGCFDPSIDEKPTSSRRAITYVGMDSRQRVCVFDVYASRETTDLVLEEIFKLYKKWHPRQFGVESVALSKIYIPLIEKEGQLRKEYVSCTPIKVSTHKSKDARIRDAIQQVAAEGRLYRQVWMREFDIEFIEFPQGRTKDILDAVSHCINMLRVPLSAEEEESDEKFERYILSQRSEITGY